MAAFTETLSITNVCCLVCLLQMQQWQGGLWLRSDHTCGRLEDSGEDGGVDVIVGIVCTQNKKQVIMFVQFVYCGKMQNFYCVKNITIINRRHTMLDDINNS